MKKTTKECSFPFYVVGKKAYVMGDDNQLLLLHISSPMEETHKEFSERLRRIIYEKNNH